MTEQVSETGYTVAYDNEYGHFEMSGNFAREQPNHRLMPGAPKCHYCNDTGMMACRSRDGQYAFAGPVPDDAKGYFDADCWYCDSGRRPEEISPREALR